MARYELGAIYRINGQNKDVYYARLLANDCYGVFAPLNGELNEDNFLQTPYRLFFACNSFAVKRRIWEKVVSPSDKTYTNRWKRPQHLANFGNFNMKLFLDQHKVYLQDGNLCKCESIEKFITLVRSGMFLLNFNTHEFIPNFLMRYYDDFPNSYIVNTVFINSGAIEYQKEQIQALRELGFEMGN